MDDSKKERLLMMIVSVSAIACIMENYIAKWEAWVPPLILFGLVGIWWLHITGRIEADLRATVYFIYTAFVVFYFGVHPDMIFDISVVIMLFMATFSMLDSKKILNCIVIEYMILAISQGYLSSANGEMTMDALMIMKALLHTGSVITLYMFCRTNVTRRMQEDERLNKWKTTVKENDNDMEDFLSNISHELRTPVNVISGMTTLLQKNMDCEELESIKAAGIRLAHQIEDIQDYTEIKRGELKLEEENYMCISLVNDVVSIFKSMENKKKLELVVDLDPTTPTLLKGDIQKLHKLFRHLLDNSIKFTNRGGINIKVYSEPRSYGANLTIEVTDTGSGMTRAQLSRLSKGMYQANKKRNRSTGGIGIGLPIVYGFVHKMGGFVRINSVKGSGTTVKLTIPQVVANPEPCLSINEKAYDGIVFYLKPEKYKVAEIREYYRDMAVNLATGLKAKLYSASEVRELERLVRDVKVSHIFTGEEEYLADKAVLDRFSSEGMKVIVNASDGFKASEGRGILVIPKPLYAFSVVRILNGEVEGFIEEGVGRVSFSGVKALIVDDEPMNLVVASGLLREYEMLPDTAESGKESIDKYKDGDYDVIYMDHMMPGMDGVEAMKRLRQVAAETGRHPIIIALTANALSGAKEMFMKEGFDGFIAKPIDIAEFERVMNRLLPVEMIKTRGRADS